MTQMNTVENSLRSLLGLVEMMNIVKQAGEKQLTIGEFNDIHIDPERVELGIFDNNDINIESHNNPEEMDSCSVCLECFNDKNIAILECGHKLHLTCYNQFLFTTNGYNTEKKCMLCRSNISNIPNEMDHILERIEEQRRLEQERLQEERGWIQRREQRRLNREERELRFQQERNEVVNNENNLRFDGFVLTEEYTDRIMLLRETETHNWNSRNVASIILNNIDRNRSYNNYADIILHLRIQGVRNSDGNIRDGIRRLSANNDSVYAFGVYEGRFDHRIVFI